MLAEPGAHRNPHTAKGERIGQRYHSTGYPTPHAHLIEGIVHHGSAWPVRARAIATTKTASWVVLHVRSDVASRVGAPSAPTRCVIIVPNVVIGLTAERCSVLVRDRRDEG